MPNDFSHTIDVSVTHDEAAVKAAREIARFITAKPSAVLSPATGETQIPLYGELVRMHKNEGLDFSHVTFFNVDEYIGVSPRHPGSFHAYMHENFYRHVNAQLDHIHIPYGLTPHAAGEAIYYGKMIKQAGGIDLQLLGLGKNGHIGFNEPGTRLNSETHEVELTRETRMVVRAAFGGKLRDVPERAVTMGIKTIFESRKIIMLACGASKANAVDRMLNGDIMPDVPASVLQMHPNVGFYFDHTAYVRPAKPSPVVRSDRRPSPA